MTIRRCVAAEPAFTVALDLSGETSDAAMIA
jgi:hypothetical protein